MEEESTPIHCPSCKGEMLSAAKDRVAVDSCPHCNTLWFDRSELEQVLKLKAPGILAAAEQGPVGRPLLPCPKCANHILSSFQIKQVELHACSGCWGILVPPASWPGVVAHARTRSGRHNVADAADALAHMAELVGELLESW